MVEFRTHRLIDGFFMDRRHVELDGPMVPGTFIVWSPETDGIRPKTGMIIGVDNGKVHIMWNKWSQDPDALGIRTLMGPRVKTKKR